MRICLPVVLTKLLLVTSAALAFATALHSQSYFNESPSISLRAAQGEQWELVYRFQEPIRGLRFAEPEGFAREQSWVIETPGYYFGRDGNYQVVVASPDASLSSQVSIVVPTDSRAGTWSIEPFNSFTDTSVALFTRHFYVMLFDPNNGNYAQETLVANLEIIPKADQHVIIRGNKSYGPMSWRDPSTEGTYAYTGTLELERLENVAMITDPGLPTWVTSIARLTIPALIDIYTERMGRPLDTQPLVLFSYEPGDALGYHYNGRVVGDLMQLRVQGAAWEHESIQMREQLTQFIADEVIKLWGDHVTASRPRVQRRELEMQDAFWRVPADAESAKGVRF